MIYAYLHTEQSVELYASESDKLPPSHYRVCSLAGFLAAWQLRDSFCFQRMQRALENPYEAELCRAAA